MIEEIMAARGVVMRDQTTRRCALEFGQPVANEFRRQLPQTGDTWHPGEVFISIAGKKHWLWRVVDQCGVVPDVLVQSRRDARAA